MKADLLRARNMKRYINQLSVAKKQCEKRIRLLGGPNYEQQEDGAPEDGEGPQSQRVRVPWVQIFLCALLILPGAFQPARRSRWAEFTLLGSFHVMCQYTRQAQSNAEKYFSPRQILFEPKSDQMSWGFRAGQYMDTGSFRDLTVVFLIIQQLISYSCCISKVFYSPKYSRNHSVFT